MRMKERLYLTEDGQVVGPDDRRGRQLLCKKGSWLDDEIAEKYGLVDGNLPGARSEPESIIALHTKYTKIT